ncbi:MAG TPA: short-chain dehydrogenase, partial [Thermoflexia bacterium]|nr:short-chain dehydrogenase [Thermoflexia bacterium]
TVAPIAATRLTREILPPDLHDRLKPEFVAPLVLYLCSEQCPVSGRIYNAGGGVYGRAAVVSGPGVHIGEGEPPTPEEVAAHWDRIVSLEGAQEYPDANAALMAMLAGEQEGKEAREQGVEGSKEAGKRGLSVRAVFEGLADRFRADKAAGVDVVFQFSISGPGGGDWFVVVKDQTCTVEEGVHPSPTTTLKMADGDFLALVEGKLSAMQAFSTGKLKIEGDLMKSQLVQRLFGL